MLEPELWRHLWIKNGVFILITFVIIIVLIHYWWLWSWVCASVVAAVVVDVCCVRTLETNVARDSYSDTAFSLWSKWPHYRYEIRMYIQYTMDANSTTCSCASNWQLNKYTSQERVPRHIQALYVFFGILVAHIAQLLNRNTTEIPPQISSWEPYGFRTRGFYLPQYLWGYIYIYIYTKPARGPQTMFLWLRVVARRWEILEMQAIGGSWARQSRYLGLGT